MRNDFLAKVDQASFEKLLNDVSAKMDTATLTSLNKQVAVDHADVGGGRQGLAAGQRLPAQGQLRDLQVATWR